jgi:hypothetical protein
MTPEFNIDDLSSADALFQHSRPNTGSARRAYIETIRVFKVEPLEVK